jgi:hypothetical protein
MVLRSEDPQNENTMKLSFLPILTLAGALAVPSFALPSFPLTFNDSTAPGDVIGNASQFDITQLRFTNFNSATKTFTVDIFMNYGGGVSLASFGGMNVGDLLFTKGANRYFVPLVNRTGLVAGNLYSATSFITAGTLVGGSAGRPTENVWGNVTGSTNLGTGSVSTACVGCPGDPNKIQVTVNFVANNAFINGFDGSSFSFSSATCANDIIQGVVPVPEPGTWMLLSVGLVGLGLFRRRAA